MQMSNTVDSMQAEAEEFGQRYNAVREMIGRVIVGHADSDFLWWSLLIGRRSRAWENHARPNIV